MQFVSPTDDPTGERSDEATVQGLENFFRNPRTGKTTRLPGVSINVGRTMLAGDARRFAALIVAVCDDVEAAFPVVEVPAVGGDPR
jgi:hypothetical protein